MKSLTMRQLRYLCALAEHKHFGRAAEACFVSQPALSTQIKEIEEMVGVSIVERGTREIHMTLLGDALVNKANEILGLVQELDDIVRAAAGELRGKFRLGVIPTIAPYLLPDVIGELGESYPDLDVFPKEAVTQILVDELLSHKLDAAIVALPLSYPAIQEFALYDEEFVLIRHIDDSKKPIPSPAQLKEMRLLLLEEGHCFREQALSYCELNSTSGREVMEGTSLSTLVQMVGAGMGVTMVPEMAVGLESKSLKISMSRFKANAPKRTIGLIWRKTNPLREQLMDIASIIRRVGQHRRDHMLCPPDILRMNR